MRPRKAVVSRSLSASAIAISAALACGGTALAQGESGDTIVVTGFRSSLGAALDQKREATGAIDAIVAEDLADFPDLNLAESLQRIPGVSINRSNGEGRSITVRGLSGLYTRVRINGMETRVHSSGGNNRDFNFDLFASELFNNIVVHKTASADLDEGSLGAVVDLNTGRPFDYKEGATLLLSGNMQYNTLSEDAGPRLAGLFAFNDPEGVFGVSASVAYTEGTSRTNTGNTVRWQKADFGSVNGTACDPDALTGDCAVVADAFVPRIPRYGSTLVNRERLGVTGSLQFAPTDRTSFTLDGMYATYDQHQDFRTLEVLFRGNEDGMDITSFAFEEEPDRFGRGNSTIPFAEVDNAFVRSETFDRLTNDEFHQITLAFEHDFSDVFRMSGLFGTAESSTDIVRETTLMYDDRDYNGYSYDYRDDDRFPSLIFGGPDVLDATNFTLTEVRDRPGQSVSGFDTAQIDFEWEASETLRVRTGFNFKRMQYQTQSARRDGSACISDGATPLARDLTGNLFDCDLDDDGTNDILGPQGVADLTDIFEYNGETGPGSTVRWAAPSLEGWTTFFDLYNVQAVPREQDNRQVEEQNMGWYAQLAGELPVGDMRLMYDAGVRYVRTSQESSGFNSGTFVTVDRPTYDDILPSGNLAFWMTDDFVLRFSGAKVIARPALSNLSPGGSVGSFNYTVSFQNPFLDPIRAKTFDASAEWYFAEESLVSLALFYKDIASFPFRDTIQGTYASTGLPLNLIVPTSPADQDIDAQLWDISTLTNGPGAEVKGLEVTAQAPFSSLFGDDLPPLIRNMGFAGNFTYVDSDVTYPFAGTEISERLIGLSNTAFNATLYYEDDRLSTRVSVANRSDYLTNGPNETGNLWRINNGATQVDFSGRYSLTDNFDLTIEALNLNNAADDIDVDIDAQRRFEYAQFGRRIIIGARLSY